MGHSVGGPSRKVLVGRLLARLGAAFALHCASLAYTELAVHRAVGGAGPACELVDAGFGALPRVRGGYGDVLPYTYLAAVVMVLGARGAWATVDEFLSLAAGLMALRAVSAAVTVLPPSDPACRTDALVVFHGGCHDKLFSGHVAYMTLSAGYLSRGLGRAVWAPVVVEAAYLVAAREHYTVDVLLAACFAALAFKAFGGKAGPWI